MANGRRYGRVQRIMSQHLLRAGKFEGPLLLLLSFLSTRSGFLRL